MADSEPPNEHDSRADIDDEARERIKRAEQEARREAVEEFAQERREEARQEELERLREDNHEDEDPPRFLEWVGGGVRRFAAGLKKLDQNLVESHSGDGDSDGSHPAVDSDREPSMPDPLDGESDEPDERDGPKLP